MAGEVAKRGAFDARISRFRPGITIQRELPNFTQGVQSTPFIISPHLLAAAFSMKKKIIVGLLALFPAIGMAQHASLKDIAQKAVLNNPEVLAKWHSLKAAGEETDAARGGFLPKADLSLGAGRETLKQPELQQNNYTRRNYVLSLSQMVFDGFATSSDVKRLDKARMARYYELLDASENAALEAAKAYYDVMRYRFLVSLAEDNYVQHKATYEQLVRRTQSGVGRRADMEQAASRLALAESNLTTEVANLHDVTARYQRIVGEQPPKTAFGPQPLSRNLPASANAALEAALQHSPALLAAVENLESAQHEIDLRRAAYMPRVDFRARTDNTTNYLGDDGLRRQNVVEVVMNYNLFNGGSDSARERQFVERKNIALDLRDKACRDMRQTLSIAYNDTQRLKEQVSILDTQVNLLEKTRDAYRDQFNVGQRTLLDLLDTENELLNARRTSINADADLNLAYIRAYAGMGKLLEVLGLQRLESGVDVKDGQDPQVDLKSLCPAEAPLVAGIDRAALNARAEALIAEQSKSALPYPVPANGSGMAAAPAGVAGQVTQQVNAWAAAWARKDYAAYAAFYAPTFMPEGGMNREDWAQLRRGRLSKPSSITVSVEELNVRVDGPTSARAEFRQTYSSDIYRDVTSKVLEFIKSGDKWLIQRESAMPLPKKP